MKLRAILLAFLLLAVVPMWGDVFDLIAPDPGAFSVAYFINDADVVIGIESGGKVVDLTPVIWNLSGVAPGFSGPIQGQVLNNPFAEAGSIPLALSENSHDALLYGITPAYNPSATCSVQPCNPVSNYDFLDPGSAPYSVHNLVFSSAWESLYRQDPNVPPCFFSFTPNVSSAPELCGGTDLVTTRSNDAGWYIEQYGPDPSSGLCFSAPPGTCGARVHIPDQVPEPASLTLLVTIVGALGIAAWRGRKTLGVS